MSRRNRRQVIAVSAFALVAFLFVITFRMAVVRGDSMLPTYRDGQILLVNRFMALNGPIRRGDVVLVKTANDVLIKRVVYLPGDEIKPPESWMFGQVWDYFEVVRPPGAPQDRSRARLKVPPGFLVVLGDNRAVSEDSRAFGPISYDDVLGRVVNAPPR